MCSSLVRVLKKPIITTKPTITTEKLHFSRAPLLLSSRQLPKIAFLLIQRYSQVATTTIFGLVCRYKYSKGSEGLLIFGKYLNKVVKALDAADIGRVVRETRDKIVVFEKNEARYDIPIHEIQQVGANVLIGLHLSDIEDRYKVEPKEPLPPWPK
jgi:hypothetical protein